MQQKKTIKRNEESAELTENRLEGLLVPITDDVHTSAVDGRRSPLLRTRSTGPIPRHSGRDEDSLRRDVPHSPRAESVNPKVKSCARFRSFLPSDKISPRYTRNSFAREVGRRGILAPCDSLFPSCSLSPLIQVGARAGSTTDYAYRYTSNATISRQPNRFAGPDERDGRKRKRRARSAFPRENTKNNREMLPSRSPASRRTVPRVARVAVIPCHGLKSKPRARDVMQRAHKHTYRFRVPVCVRQAMPCLLLSGP